MHPNQARRNIWLLYIFRALRSALIVMPVIVLFFQQNGLSQTQIFVLQSAFAAAILLLEVPSGYIADRCGRKPSILLGAVLATTGFALYALSYGFWPLLIAEVILGFGVSFVSGADAALAYDTLNAVKQQSRYRKFESNSLAFSGGGEALASIAGGLIAIASLRATVVVQVAVTALLIPVALMLVEPARHQTNTVRNAFADTWRITKYVLHGHQEIKWLILFAAVTTTMTHTLVWLIQPYYQAIGVPVGWFGILWAAQFVLMAAFAQLAGWYERFGRQKVFTSLITIGVFSYILTGILPGLWMIPLLLVSFMFMRGVFTPIIRDYVNQLAASNIRATVLSVQSFAHKVLYIGAGPLIGWVMDVWSLQAALLFSAAFYGILGAFVLIMMKRAHLL